MTNPLILAAAGLACLAAGYFVGYSRAAALAAPVINYWRRQYKMAHAGMCRAVRWHNESVGSPGYQSRRAVERSGSVQ